MNCLVHVPRADLCRVLRSVRKVLHDAGIFYWGQYCSDMPFEGIYEHDSYEPKRFFSTLAADEIQQAAAEQFGVVNCRRIPFDGARWDYNALILQAR